MRVFRREHDRTGWFLLSGGCCIKSAGDGAQALDIFPCGTRACSVQETESKSCFGAPECRFNASFTKRIADMSCQRHLSSDASVVKCLWPSLPRCFSDWGWCFWLHGLVSGCNCSVTCPFPLHEIWGSWTLDSLPTTFDAAHSSSLLQAPSAWPRKQVSEAITVVRSRLVLDDDIYLIFSKSVRVA